MIDAYCVVSIKPVKIPGTSYLHMGEGCSRLLPMLLKRSLVLTLSNFNTPAPMRMELHSFGDVSRTRYLYCNYVQFSLLQQT